MGGFPRRRPSNGDATLTGRISTECLAATYRLEVGSALMGRAPSETPLAGTGGVGREA
jgi:hypothetical protein